MQLLFWLLLGVIVLSFCGVFYFACSAWRTTSPGRRIAGALLLTPHFLLVVCIVVSLICGKGAQGSRCYNAAFLSDALMVFILPLPALAGTLVALSIFKRTRTGE